MSLRPTDIRKLRPVDPPLASYLRPMRRDLTFLAHVVAQGLPTGAGFVIDAAHESDSAALRKEARRAGLEVVLDSRAMELATPGGFARPAWSALPWAGDSMHTTSTFGQLSGLLVREYAEMAIRSDATAVLAPAHFLDGRSRSWIATDVQIVQKLRRELDDQGGSQIAIYYPLASQFAALDSTTRRFIVGKLRTAPIDAVWLRMHNFGTTSSGPTSFRRYIELCRDLHELSVPLVGEHLGALGLAMLSLGAVGGIESGITVFDKFSVSSLRRISDGKGFAPPPRVYLTSIAALLPRKPAGELLKRRGMRDHHCRGQGCCARGADDMLSDPRRHFVVTRSREVLRISNLPRGVRSSQYLDTFLRPASDRATRAMAVEPSLGSHRQRLDQWRGTMSAIVEEENGIESSYSGVPNGGRLSRKRPA